jgi:hypothetical protein
MALPSCTRKSELIFSLLEAISLIDSLLKYSRTSA